VLAEYKCSQHGWQKFDNGVAHSERQVVQRRVNVVGHKNEWALLYLIVGLTHNVTHEYTACRSSKNIGLGRWLQLLVPSLSCHA